MEQTPIDGWEVESCVIGLCYKRLLQQFTFFPVGKKTITINLNWAEAFAINNYFSANSAEYNIFLRMSIEPKLPQSKAYETV